MKNSANTAYYELLHRCWYKGTQEFNIRTGTQTQRIDRAWFLDFNVLRYGLPLFGNRQYYLQVAAAETAWQFLGVQDATFIMKYAPKLWGKFLKPKPEDGWYDGEKKEVVETAYGYRWQRYFGRNQIELALDALRTDSTNRQCWISAWDPSRDGLGEPDQPPNIPCPVGFSLNRTDFKLNMAVTIRSSDIVVGLPYDVLAYSMTLLVLANTLKLKPGHLSFMLCHPHFYLPQREIMRTSLVGNPLWIDWSPKSGMMTDSNWTFNMVRKYPDLFVEQWKSYGAEFNHPYKPSVAVIV